MKLLLCVTLGAVFVIVEVLGSAAVIAENAIANQGPGAPHGTALPLKLLLVAFAAHGLSNRRGDRRMRVVFSYLILVIVLYGLIREVVRAYAFQEGVNAGAL
ncbi:MAG: hypothetical protein IPL77_05865 [Flavobacteriales bacterium]|jgi:hypothetical protein|nr:hypothetical protein [Flavobacteriales bacterium]MBK9538036.1 hypothetical protein [Flavobacteriales bacterium]